jgi:hypothetical protein
LRKYPIEPRPGTASEIADVERQARELFELAAQLVARAERLKDSAARLLASAASEDY